MEITPRKWCKWVEIIYNEAIMDARSSYFDQQKIDPLNTREAEILGLMAEGLSNSQIALRLNLSQETVKWYNKHLFLKLGAESRSQAVAIAVENGLFGTRAPAETRDEPRPTHNLPAALTSFVGRVKEIDDINRLLKTNRLVVLTGAGGSGKTRLALQVARGQIGRFRDGVWLVELAALTDPALVGQAVSQGLGLAYNSEETPATVVKRFLARKHLLLILDNFEHLLDAATLVSEILSAAPQVVILATSRERLHIYGEYEFPVYPLNLPDPNRKETLQQVLGHDALVLFFQRVQSVRPELKMDEAQVAAAAQICTQLDGLPLALELAASQVKIYTLGQLAEHLKENLTGLPAGPRDLPARQRTLRATIEWSYSLLSGEEKNLFARLAVFEGGATLDAVEEMCGENNPEEVRDRLSSLVDKNMIVPREGRDGELHHTLLETIREYALECLEKSGELDRLRHKHATYYARMAEGLERDIRSAKQAYWFARLRTERENIRAITAVVIRTKRNKL